MTGVDDWTSNFPSVPVDLVRSDAVESQASSSPVVDKQKADFLVESNRGVHVPRFDSRESLC